MSSILILNTGGTLNKRYNPIKGSLFVPSDNIAIEAIMANFASQECEIKGLIYKDSLEIDDFDRRQMLECIASREEKRIVIVHGTDTMSESAEYIAKEIADKTIIFTGAMKPYEIDHGEASCNLAMALGFLQQPKLPSGIYMCMSGIIAPHANIKKDKQRGVFARL